MASSRTHLITYFLLLSIPFASSLTFNLTNISPQVTNPDIVIQGSGADITDGEIQLTPNVTNQIGRATYSRPLHLWNSTSGELASFTTNFTFVIDSNGREYFGDGFTFFLAENNSEIYGGGNMGLPINYTINSTTQFVAVEFDTFWNRNWDPLTPLNISIGHHVGISISSLVSVSSQKWSTNVPGGGVCQAWIKYDSDLKNLSVSFTGFQNNTAFRQDGLYYTVDLSKVLPEWVIFGFSAATGALQQNSKVRSWTFDSSNLRGDEDSKVPQIPSPDPDLVNEKDSKMSLVVSLVVGILATITLLGLLVFALWWKKKKKKKKNKEEVEESGIDADLNEEYQMGIGPKRFSYHELAQSTNDFEENKKLGEGGFGGVYRGFLEESNTYIAVKRVSKSSKQGINEYASEVRIISRLRHRNMVQLMGWCHEKGNLLLVYQYMENGSLDSHLFKGKSLLTWGTRYKIAHGVASALMYLHEEWEQCVLHRDIKSSNVMLDSNFNAKLGDFGLAKFVDHEKGAQTTKLAGTLGYMAPECAMTGKATKESDVFSFGVVLLEITCGRKPIEYKAPENQVWLLEWIWDLYGVGILLEAVDPRLGSDFDEEEIMHLMIVGLWCVHPDPKFRPSMRQVIQVLNVEASLPMLPSKMVISSYWKPSTIENHASTMVSNKDSSNKSLFFGR